jgi:hypothetical protein
MRRRPPWIARSSWLALAVALALAASAPRARADERELCLDAYVAAQRLRKEKHLIEARDKLLVCMRDVCPQVAQAGCASWLPEVQESLPTAVFSAVDGAGRPRADVRLSLDGHPFRDKLDGGAVPIDPGEHHLRWEAPAEAPIDETIAVREGVKNQQFTARFPIRVAAPPPIYHRRSSPWMFVLAGVGVVGGAGFAFFGVESIGHENTLRTSCSPNCSPSDVSAVRLQEHAADISLAVGVAATIGAFIMLVTRPKVLDPPRPPASALHGPLLLRF